MSDQPPSPPPPPGGPPSADEPPAPGYWKASDGNWYPPQQATPPPPPAPPSPSAPPPPGPAMPPPPGAPGPQPQGYLGHGQPAPGMGQVYGTAPPSNGFAVASLVLGILSLLMFWTFGVGIVVGVLAVVFGILGRKRAKDMAGDGKAGLAMAGLITGVLGVLGGIAFVVLLVAAADELEDFEFNTDPADGVCDPDRLFQDPDC